MFEPDPTKAHGAIVMRVAVADAINAVIIGLPSGSDDVMLALAQVAMALGLRPMRQAQPQIKVLR